jgi:hypothetical protein
MYAYAAQKGQHHEYWENYDFKTESSTVPKPRELAYWRKHPNLHGWMERLWAHKINAEGGSVVDQDGWSTFNGVELELTLDDLALLEQDVEKGRLPATQGFFFGNDADQYYKPNDLAFIQEARTAIAAGEHVFYNSSW